MKKEKKVVQSGGCRYNEYRQKSGRRKIFQGAVSGRYSGIWLPATRERHGAAFFSFQMKKGAAEWQTQIHL
jgi:hypothetical protein